MPRAQRLAIRCLEDKRPGGGFRRDQQVECDAPVDRNCGLASKNWSSANIITPLWLKDVRIKVDGSRREARSDASDGGPGDRALNDEPLTLVVVAFA